MAVATVGSRVSNAVTVTAPPLGGFNCSVAQSDGEGGPFSTRPVTTTQFGGGLALIASHGSHQSSSSARGCLRPAAWGIRSEHPEGRAVPGLNPRRLKPQV